MKFSLANEYKTKLSDDIAGLIDLDAPTSSWLKNFRTQEFSRFIKQSLPDRKTEHWKYNDVSFLGSENFTNAKISDKSNYSPSPLHLNETIIFVFIDGIFYPEHSTNQLGTGISATSFSDANEKQIKIISSHLTSAKQQKNSLIQFNNSFSQNGLLIEIEKNKQITCPIYLYNISDNKVENQLTSNHVVINCEENSQCQIIEHFSSKGNTSVLSLQQSVINIEKLAQVDYCRVNLEKDSHRQIGRSLFLLQKQSRLKSFFYSEGSQLNKTDIDVFHQGAHSESQITGIYLPSENKVIDYHLNVEHQVANCTSRELFRGIIADSAKATFNGKIHIFKDAQKSDAQLSNKNLLLTNQAEVNTKPELEIYADDVVCAHGATVAKIDDKAIYYLQTRGIDKTRAKKMLSIGFINELLEQIKNTELKSFLTARVQAELSEIKDDSN